MSQVFRITPYGGPIPGGARVDAPRRSLADGGPGASSPAAIGQVRPDSGNTRVVRALTPRPNSDMPRP